MSLVSLDHHPSQVDSSPAAETISDFILVIAPLWILRRVRVSLGLRIRLIAIFSCSMMTTVAGIVHAVMVLKMPGALEAIMGEQLYSVRRVCSTAYRKSYRRGCRDAHGSLNFLGLSFNTCLSSFLSLAFFPDSDLRLPLFDPLVVVVQVPSRTVLHSASATFQS